MIRAEAFESQPPAHAGETIRPKACVRWDPLLSADEECELADRIKGGDQAARRQLIQANLRVVVEIARRFRGGKVSLDDLIQEGNLGLIRASADFDPSVHGCRFYTYAEVWIRAFIHRALVRDDSLIRVPERVFLQRKQYRRVRQAPGRAGVADDGPSEAGSAGTEGITREIGGTPRRLDPDRPAEPGRVAHTFVADAGEIVPLTDTILDNHLPEQQVADQEQRLLLEVALRRLNPVEAWVIRERYGLCLLIPEERDWSSLGPHVARRDEPVYEADAEADSPGQCRAYFHRSYTELGRDCGLSRHRIQQVEETALEKLRDVLRPRLVHAE
jgi:RNA polymerase sigma factor (sigma-70 family)